MGSVFFVLLEWIQQPSNARLDARLQKSLRIINVSVLLGSAGTVTMNASTVQLLVEVSFSRDPVLSVP